MTERDRLAQALIECEHGGEVEEADYYHAYAERLISAGWTDLPPERLRRALIKSGWPAEGSTATAGAIAAAYWEERVT